MKYPIYSILFTILIFSGSCKRDRLNINVSNIDIDLKINRFDQSLFNISDEDFEPEITNLRNSNIAFFDLFTYQMIKIGGIDEESFLNNLNAFISDTMIQNVKAMVEEEFSDLSKTEKEIKKAFQHYRYYFPDKAIPEIYSCISGFNQSIVIADNLIGISLDKYLGSECIYYNMLGTPKYKQLKMYKKRIPADVMYGWATSEYIKSGNESNLLSHMIHEGKLMYFIDAMLPSANDTIKIGYTFDQLEWCKNNEAQMWSNLIEKKLLYKSGRMDIKRFIDDGPYTNSFPLESPGRAGVWIVWNIVRQYMEKHPEISLNQLMGINDSQKILNDSKYFPD